MNRTAQVVSMFLFLVILGAPPVGAIDLAPDAPQTYVVRAGDTLWEIAGRFLREPWRWPQVWQANRGELGRDPDRIYPGDVLQLRMVDGRPQIGRAGAGAGGMRVVRLSPRVRSEQIDAAIPVVPIGHVAPFLTRPQVTDPDTLRKAPYVVGFPGEHIVAGLNDAIYVRKILTANPGRFHVLRPGAPLRDPDTNALLGYQADFVAEVRLERIGDPARLAVVDAEREVAIGDRLIAADDARVLSDFHPHPAPSGTRGRIISVVNGVSQVGRYDVVVINRGAKQGLEPGHVYAIYAGGGKMRDQVKGGLQDARWSKAHPLSAAFWLGDDYEFKGFRRDGPAGDAVLQPEYRKRSGAYVAPYEQAGSLMVFRVFEEVSFALVMEAEQAFRVGDWIDPPPA